MARSFTTTALLTGSTIAVPTTTGTIAFWGKPTWNSGDGVTHKFWEYLTTGEFSFQKFTDNNVYIGWNASGDQRVTGADTGIFVSGTWAHHTLTYSTSVGSKYYVNGVQKYTNGTNAVTASETTITIGNSATGVKSCEASMADWAMWNVLLSVGEIAALANGARPGYVRPNALVDWYPIGAGSPDPDFSGNAKNQTVTGTAVVADPPLMMITPRWWNITAASAASSTVVYRRSLSPLGTRAGSRQLQGSA